METTAKVIGNCFVHILLGSFSVIVHILLGSFSVNPYNLRNEVKGRREEKALPSQETRSVPGIRMCLYVTVERPFQGGC